MSCADASQKLARFVADHPPSSIPKAAQRSGRLALLNWFGCTIAGGGHDTIDRLVAGFRAMGADGTVPLLGRRETLNMLAATTVNGAASAVLDFDSPQHRKTNIHPSGPIAPALLAICAGAATYPVTGAQFLHAYLLGVEVACRVANTVFGRSNPGWHVTGAAGGIGAAAAAARLLGADANQVRAALGIAATQACGLREMYGTMCKALTPGRSGENGLLAAQLALQGFTSAEHPLEGSRGFAAVFAGGAEIEGLTEGLGESFEIEAMAHKPYPCAVVTHAVIDACIVLRSRVEPAMIADVLLTVSPVARELAGKENPDDGLASKFSLSHAAAVALIYGAARTEHFTTEAARHAATSAMRRRVRIETDPRFLKETARVMIRASDGRSETVLIPAATGSPDNPMTEAGLVGKFRGLTEPVLGAPKSDALARLLLAIEEVEDMKQLAWTCVKRDFG